MILNYLSINELIIKDETKVNRTTNDYSLIPAIF